VTADDMGDEMGRKKEYTEGSLTVRYEAARCIHAAECVRSLPAVFDPERRPWIDVSAAEAARVAEAVELCPTGALTYEHHGSNRSEAALEAASATIMPNGPIYLKGQIDVTGADGSQLAAGTRLALCRCGLSKRKPFCDGSHTDGFEAE